HLTATSPHTHIEEQTIAGEQHHQRRPQRSDCRDARTVRVQQSSPQPQSNAHTCPGGFITMETIGLLHPLNKWPNWWSKQFISWTSIDYPFPHVSDYFEVAEDYRGFPW
uniref:Uncharacterized protein n=1 Tax=Oryzias latipes TaxID=8090 RepID=A0A3P9LRW1_ORYLA